ncbi:MAG: transporter [Massilia sp.]|nr:transporter [Massilia sp.]
MKSKKMNVTKSMNSPVRRSAHRTGLALALAGCAVLAGCATPANPQDPLEKVNRVTFAFNDTVDRVALKPAATAYKKVLPGFAQTGVNNFFGNLSDAWSSVNNLLQGKGADGMSDLTRFALNSTFGIAGILDIASEAGLQKHNEDFGQTLGVWGVPAGPYLMLPLLGPSTIRDTAALPLDFAADIWAYKTPVNWRNVGIGTRAIDQRATVLDASNLMEEAALDRYEFIRDGYLQRRQSRVFDGESAPSDRAAPDEAQEAPAAATPAPASNTQVVPEPATPAETQRK